MESADQSTSARPCQPATAFDFRPRLVIHPVGRVGDHQVRLDAAEHALDVRRDRAVAAEEAMPPEQPQIARLRDRMLRSGRRVVRIRQPRTEAIKDEAIRRGMKKFPSLGACARPRARRGRKSKTVAGR